MKQRGKKKQPGGLPQLVILWWNIIVLRWEAATAALSLRVLLHKGKKAAARAGKAKSGLPFFLSLSLCAAVALTGGTLSVMSQGAPRLRGLDGKPLHNEELVLLDPNRRDETRLSPGYLYDRQVAAVQNGTQPVLLRVRLEETLLTVRRDANGLVVVIKGSRSPDQNFIPRTVPQKVALSLLEQGGFIKKNATWEQVLAQKLPASRLPGGSNDGGRLLAFEKKTVTVSKAEGVDVSALLPEDIEGLEMARTTYAYMGFYLREETADGQIALQPIHFQLDETPTKKEKPEPPLLTAVGYEFFPWDEKERRVRLFGSDKGQYVDFQPGELRPLSSWAGPAEAWFYDDDGWIYYGQPLAPGATTPLLLRSFSVGSDSPLVKDETRYRLELRAQSAPLERQALLDLWHSGAPLGGLGGSELSNQAANFVIEVLKLKK